MVFLSIAGINQMKMGPQRLHEKCLLDLPLVSEEGRCGPHLMASSCHGPLIMRLTLVCRLYYLGVLVFCLDLLLRSFLDAVTSCHHASSIIP
jgi:hypothetical protein